MSELPTKQFVYQLHAKGYSAVFPSSRFDVRTSTVFLDEKKAIENIDKFKKICLDSTKFDYAVEEGLEIKILPLEIFENRS